MLATVGDNSKIVLWRVAGKTESEDSAASNVTAGSSNEPATAPATLDRFKTATADAFPLRLRLHCELENVHVRLG